MATITFTRLSSGQIKAELIGNTKILPPDGWTLDDSGTKIIFSRAGDKVFEIETNGNTIIENGNTASGSAIAIAEVLATTTFFKSSGGGAAELYVDDTYLNGDGSEESPLAVDAAVLPVSTAQQMALDLKLDNSPFIIGAQALGAPIFTQTLGINSISQMVAAGNNPMVDGQMIIIAVPIPYAKNITKVWFYQVTQGAYTADNYTGVGIYTTSGGAITLVASSVDDGSLYKAPSNTYVSKALSASYAASKGVVYVALLCNNSVVTTTPVIGGAIAAGNVAMHNGLFTNNNFVCGYKLSQNTLPSSMLLSSANGALTNLPWVGLE